MALAYDQHKIGITRTGNKTTVDDNDIAKLMYYLNCVCNTIECNEEPEIRRFIDYTNWFRLSTNEQQQLFVLCYTLSPDIFDDKVFFQNDALCTTGVNEFYEISQVNSQLLAASSIVIAGQTRRVNKIMTYKMYWMQFYYFEPMQRLSQCFSKKKRSRCIIS